MKQRPTVKQVNELSEKGKETLRKWGLKHLRVGDLWFEHQKYMEEHADWDKKDSYVVRLWDGDESEEYSQDPRQHDLMWPLLSIGQMIEFVFDWEDKTDMTFNFVNIFTVEPSRPFDLPWVFYDRDNGELCDALWEAVKEVL